MMKQLAAGIILTASTLIAAPSMAAGDPSLHEVYQAAEAGKLNEAQAMMRQVLQDHPNSAKAHFVEAELLGKQGLLTKAEAELKTAERLAPGLPFAKPQAVQNLENRIAQAHVRSSYMTMPANAYQQNVRQPNWLMILLSIGAIGALIYLFRSFVNRNMASVTPAGAGMRYASSYPSPAYGGNGMAQPMGQTGGGMGSGIMSGLATGAALGAGIAAGEALVHHFTDGDKQQRYQPEPPSVSTWNTRSDDDMGGNDFGVTDSLSWDDSSPSDDWDS